MENVYDWSLLTKYLCISRSYPYVASTTATNGTCVQNYCQKVSKASAVSYVSLRSYNDIQLMTMVNSQPIAIGVASSSDQFQFVSNSNY